jgi:hypothetical protein
MPAEPLRVLNDVHKGFQELDGESGLLGVSRKGKNAKKKDPVCPEFARLRAPCLFSEVFQTRQS